MSENTTAPRKPYNQMTPAERERLSEERLKAYQARRDNLNLINISLVFEALDAEPNQDGDPRKWKLNGYNIIHKGQGWKNVSTDIDKGYGGVSLVKHALNMEREGMALEWMEKRFASDLNNDDIRVDPSADDDSNRTQADFTPPDRADDRLPDVESYLTRERGIPTSLVKSIIASNHLYAARHWDKETDTTSTRCVFLGPASAEVRETRSGGFNGCCRGSATDSSGFMVPFEQSISENILAMEEAAIDALSYRTLFPGRYVFSTNGAGRFNLQYKLAIQAIESDVGVRMALDADFPGDRASQRVFNSVLLRVLLSERLGVEPEQVDNWLLSDAKPALEDETSLTAADSEVDDERKQSAAIAAIPGNSPHEMFFNIGWQPQLPEHKLEMVETEKGLRPAWKPTGQMLQPSIRLRVTKEVHPKMPRGEHWIKVSEASYRKVVEEFNLRRDRTPWGKDWNDSLRKLGSAYNISYEKAAKNGFKDGPPALPYELEVLRNPKLERPVAAPSRQGRPLSF